MTTELQQALQKLLDFAEGGPQMNTIGLSEKVDIYVMLSRLSTIADEKRKAVRDDLKGEVGKEEVVSGSWGSVRRVTRKQRKLKSDDRVNSVMSTNDISYNRYTSPDKDKVESIVADRGIRPGEVFNLQVSDYIQLMDSDIDELVSDEPR